MQDSINPEVAAARHANYDISPLLLNRWSPRSLTGEELSDEEIMPLFEAARWAPSSFNNQPWRFIIAKRQNKTSFDRFFSFLNEGNRKWCHKASVLVLITSAKNFEYNGKPTVTSAFDAGAAWENLAIEAARRELVAHGMEGFDKDLARRECQVPDDFSIHAMIAIGKRGPIDQLSQDLADIESPNGRRPLKEIVFDGTFGNGI